MSFIHPNTKGKTRPIFRRISRLPYRPWKRGLVLGSAVSASVSFFYCHLFQLGEWILYPVYWVTWDLNLHEVTMVAIGMLSWGAVIAATVWLVASLPDIVRPPQGSSLRRHRYPPGHCQSCGYDLTGNVSGVCPECGTEIERDE